MTRAKDISKILTDADFSGALDVTGAFTSQGIDDNANATAITISEADKVLIGTTTTNWSGASTLLVKEASGDGGITIVSASTSNNGNIGFADTEGNDFANMRGLITYLHSDDAFRFMTANAERVRITSSGNVGIGTSSPATTLHVDGVVTVDRVINATTSSDPWLKGVNGSNTETFFLKPSGQAYFGGSVGIGTSSPSELIHANGSAVSALQLTTDTYTNGTVFKVQGDGSSYIYNTENAMLRFGTNNLERIRIDGSGRVGIGATSLGARLNIVGANSDTWAASATNGLALNGSDQAATSTITTYLDSSSVRIGAGVTQKTGITITGQSTGTGSTIQFRAGNSERMRIRATGNVGIGETSPQRKLDVNGIAKFRNSITLGGSGSSTDYNAYFVNESFANNADTNTVTLGTHSTRPLIFATNTTERVRIDSSGNVGIGTSSPATYGKLALQVDGTTTPTTADNVKGSSVNLYAATNGGSTDNTVGIFGWQAGQPGIGSGIGFSRESSGNWGSQIRFYTHPTTTSNISDITERMRINASGALTFYQNSSSVTQRYENAGYAPYYIFRFAMTMAGNTAYTITVSGFGNGTYKYDMFGSHWSSGYHAYRNSYIACQSSGLHTEFNLHNASSTAHGAFSVSYSGTSGRINFIKSAGTYIGEGITILEIIARSNLTLHSVS